MIDRWLLFKLFNDVPVSLVIINRGSTCITKEQAKLSISRERDLVRLKKENCLTVLVQVVHTKENVTRLCTETLFKIPFSIIPGVALAIKEL